ncbi:hypothetical protein ACFFSH_14045 [Streptomyces filamentosus]|uniref:Uncharacterized protein n=1 Tax=Streptomyces filamentosus TaxID=67294 RepID=A0A919BSR5_STRFL|nr:hypothetical protein GCM10017667_46670 [Streptomyces filamentosus]
MVSDEANGTTGTAGTGTGEAAATAPGPAGTAVLLAAAPAGRGRAMDAASVLPVLAAVPPGVLTGTATATLVELADPVDPQTVLTRLRAAAQSPGPLVLCLVGQLHLDRRQRLPHLALARSTSAALRYTALPWHWLAQAVAHRPSGATTIVADLVADAETWTRLGADPGLLAPGPLPALYARVGPPPRRGERAAPDYLRAWADQWRAGARLPFPALHAEAAARTQPSRALFLAPGEREPAGRAAPVPGTSAVAVAPPVPAPPPPPMPMPVPVAAPAAAPVPPPRPSGVPPLPTGFPAAPAPAEDELAPGTMKLTPPKTPGTPKASKAAVAEGRAGEGAAPGAATPIPAAAPEASAAPAAHDPHPAILAAATAGRHAEAAEMAAAWERDALRRFGPRSQEAVHWMEVRADLARLAGEPARSCELWLAVAEARLGLRQRPDDRDVEGAVDRAHHQWEQIDDPARARSLGPALVALRRRVPGRRPGALEALRRRMHAR